MASDTIQDTCHKLDMDFEDVSWGIESEDCLTQELSGAGVEIAPNWQTATLVMMNEYIRKVIPKWLDTARMESLEKEVILIKNRCELLEYTAPIQVHIQTLAPEPYEIINPLIVVVRRKSDQYIASIFDANISASGDTETEAIFNLKDILVSSLDMFEELDEAQLGPGPLRQKQVLYEFIRKKR